MLKSKKQTLQSLIFLIGIALLISLFSLFLFGKTQYPPPPQACYQGYCFSLEIADTPKKRAHGLMFRDSLPQNQGMLFIFEQADFWSFWMKNTLIPLDIVRLNGKNQIIDFTSVAPCLEENCPSYFPLSPASRAIEFNSGTMKKIGIQIGDSFKITGY